MATLPDRGRDASRPPQGVALPSLGEAPGDRPSVVLEARGWIFGGICAICIVFGGVGGWGATAPLASAVIAGGQVTVDTKRKRVQHLEGGIVAELRVRDGDKVRAGDVLVRLDDTRARATLSIVRGSLHEALAKEARLIAERDGEETATWPDALLSEQDDPAVRTLLRSQQTIFDSRRATLAGETQILAERIEQLKQEIAGLGAQRTSKDRQISFIQKELKVLLDLLRRGQTTQRRVLALQREAARLEGEQGELTADIARSEKAIGETRLEVIQKQRTFRNEVVSELRDVQAKIHDLRERSVAARDVLERIEVRAPVAGKIVGLTVHAVDSVVKPGDTILEIVPSDDLLLVEVQVQPHDIDNVSIGQEAEVRFLAFKQRDTPTLHGSVTYVSADAMHNQHDGTTFYAARIEVSEEELQRLRGETLQPGMPAEVMIRTGERTALKYLIQPIIDSMNRAWREE